jgi:hypothetical protein
MDNENTQGALLKPLLDAAGCCLELPLTVLLFSTAAGVFGLSPLPLSALPPATAESRKDRYAVPTDLPVPSQWPRTLHPSWPTQGQRAQEQRTLLLTGNPCWVWGSPRLPRHGRPQSWSLAKIASSAKTGARGAGGGGARLRPLAAQAEKRRAGLAGRGWPRWYCPHLMRLLHSHPLGKAAPPPTCPSSPT